MSLDTTTARVRLLTCDNEAQALDRAGLTNRSEDKGYEAAAAALVTALTCARSGAATGTERSGRDVGPAG